MDLKSLNTAELKAELKRRKEKFHVTVKGAVFDLTLDEIREIRGQFDKIDPPQSDDAWNDILKKIAEKNKYVPPVVPQPKPWPYPTVPAEKPYWDSPSFPDPHKIYCEVKESPIVQAIIEQFKRK